MSQVPTLTDTEILDDSYASYYATAPFQWHRGNANDAFDYQHGRHDNVPNQGTKGS